MTRRFALAVLACIVTITSDSSRARGGELDIGIVDPIGKVGDIGKVGPLENVGDKTPGSSGTRSLADTGYLVCWSWNLARASKWRCTEQLADLPQAREFSNYQNGRYELGQSFFLPVYKKEWEDPAARKVVMERVQQSAIPKAMERVAAREDQPDANPKRAERIRTRIKFVQITQPEWVDVKPELPKGVKATDARFSKTDGYADDGLLKASGPSTVEVVTGSLWHFNSDVNSPASVFKFYKDGNFSMYYSSYAKQALRSKELSEDILADKPLNTGTWSDRGNGVIEASIRAKPGERDDRVPYTFKITGDEVMNTYGDGTVFRSTKFVPDR